jgi:hypothetical protein
MTLPKMELFTNIKPKHMKIEVKNIKTNMAFSEETICFKADVYVNGKKVFYAENDGHGGMTSVMPYGIDERKIYHEVIEYLASKGKDEIERKYPLEYLVDDVIDDYVNERERKKFNTKREKDAEKCLVIYKDDEYSYSKISWGKFTIDQLLKSPQGRNAIHTSVLKYKNMGYKIHNNNIPAELLN